MATVILGIGALVFLAHLLATAFQRTRIPDVLMLIGIGILLGPATGVVHSDDLGKVGEVLGEVALVVILFEGGTTLDLGVLGRSLTTTLRLALGTFVATVAVVATAGNLAFDLPLLPSLILGGTLAGIAPPIVIPLARSLKVTDKTNTVVVLESALAEVLAIVMVFSLLTAALAGAVSAPRLVGSTLSAVLFAALLGVLGGVGWLRALELVRRLPNSMFVTFAFVFVVYGLTEMLGFSGGIAALAFGITLTNHERFGLDRLAHLKLDKLATLTPPERAFFGEVVFLVKTFFFVFLGLSIGFGDVRIFAVAAVVTVAVYLARMLVTRYALAADTPRRDASVLAMMIPKGLAAAVLAGLPIERGLPYGEILRDISYAVVLMSIIMTAVMVWAMERVPLRNLFDRVYAPFAGEVVPPPAPLEAAVAAPVEGGKAAG